MTSTGYLHMSQEMLAPILRTGVAEVKANAPKGNDALLGCIALHRYASDHLEAFTLIQFLAESYQFRSQGWKVKIANGNLLHTQI